MNFGTNSDSITPAPTQPLFTQATSVIWVVTRSVSLYFQYIQEPNIQLTRPLAQCFNAEVIKLSGDIDKDNFKILDVAAGTGLLGIELSKHGYRNIDALDMSQKMLNQARVKKIYRNFICTTMTDQQIPIIATGEYDALTCCASMGAGHVGPSALEEMIRVTKPG